MKEDPRFVCRREGHEPSISFSGMPFVLYFISTCRRCGKVIEFNNDGTERKTA